MSNQGYDPNRSVTNPDKLAAFIQAAITGDLIEVPGCGPNTIKILKENGISTTFGLFGKFFISKRRRYRIS